MTELLFGRGAPAAAQVHDTLFADHLLPAHALELVEPGIDVDQGVVLVVAHHPVSIPDVRSELDLLALDERVELRAVKVHAEWVDEGTLLRPSTS